MLALGGGFWFDVVVLGRVDRQRSLFDTGVVFADRLSGDSFYAWLREFGDALLCDDDFAGLYSQGWGRPSHPPSVMFRALLLQAYDQTSDREAARRTRVDEDWRAALGFDLFASGIGATTLSLFRARLVIHDMDRVVFRQVLAAAREGGVSSGRRVGVIDSTALEGAVAAQSARQVLCGLMRKAAQTVGDEQLVELVDEVDRSTSGLGLDDPRIRGEAFNRLLEVAERVLEAVEGYEKSVEVGRQLAMVVAQQAESAGGSGSGRVKKDRVVSHCDPEVRYGVTMGGQFYLGYKLHQITDPDSDLVLAVSVGAANQPDADQMLGLVAEACGGGIDMGGVVGDTAYGTAETRRLATEMGVEVFAPIPPAPNANRGRFSKDEFVIDVDTGSVKCPAGAVTQHFEWNTNRKGQRVKRFRFDADTCGSCGLNNQCVSGDGPRTVKLHPDQDLIEHARRRLNDPEVQTHMRHRYVVERKNARLKMLGMRKTRYRGRRRVELTAYLAATVANFTRLVNLNVLNPQTVAAA